MRWSRKRRPGWIRPDIVKKVSFQRRFLHNFVRCGAGAVPGGTDEGAGAVPVRGRCGPVSWSGGVGELVGAGELVEQIAD